MTPTLHTPRERASWQVCPTCQGDGTIGPGWVLTSQDILEMGDEFDVYMESMQTGVFDVVCVTCGGKRVVKEPCACRDCELERDLAWEDELSLRAERAIGC